MKISALILLQTVPNTPIDSTWHAGLFEFASKNLDVSIGAITIALLFCAPRIITSLFNGINEIKKTDNAKKQMLMDHEHRMFIAESKLSEEQLIALTKNVKVYKMHQDNDKVA